MELKAAIAGVDTARLDNLKMHRPKIVFCGAVTHRKGFRKKGRGSRKGRVHSSAEEISLT
jgi:hypothetical protein